jgi:hypothetical protein
MASMKAAAMRSNEASVWGLRLQTGTGQPMRSAWIVSKSQ